MTEIEKEDEFDGTTWQAVKEEAKDSKCWMVKTKSGVHYVYARSIKLEHGALYFTMLGSDVVACYSPDGYESAVRVDPETKRAISLEVGREI